MSDGRARPLVLAAPSGAGKTSIAHELVRGDPSFVFSVSATTRPMRAGERDGVDYDFVTPDDFDRLLARGELLEWAEVHGQRYGTPRRNVERAAREGRHVVLDIDVQGARQVRAAAPDALQVFVLPPSTEALVGRLVRRGTEEAPDLVRRLRNARAELLEAATFDHVVVNDELATAVRCVQAFVNGEEPPVRLAEPVERVVGRLRDGIAEVLEAMGGETADGGAET